MRARAATKAFFAFFLVFLTPCGHTSAQKSPHRATSVIDLFSQEAAASSTVGIHKYSEDLIDLLIPSGVSDETRREVIDMLANRLARVEERARAGHGKLIPEANVVQAFNALMKGIDAPSNLRATEETVWKFRVHAVSIKAFPALFSADRNGKNCNPGEAVFLLYLLTEGDGKLSEQDLDSAKVLTQLSNQRNQGIEGYGVGRVGTAPVSQWLLYRYSWHHDHDATGALFRGVADMLSF